MTANRFRAGLTSLILAASLAVPANVAFAVDGRAAPEDVETIPSEQIELCSNNTDTAYSFTFSKQGATQGTPWRAKEDYSSVYVKITAQSGNAPRFYVDGAYGNLTGKKDCTQGTHVANRKGEFCIYNSVREDGRTMARLTSWACTGPGKVSGVWSPDCVGTFPQL